MSTLLHDPALPAILIDNVAEYYFTGTDQEIWDLGKHFPNLAPPFPLCWMEHKLPKVIRSEIGDTRAPAEIDGRAGILAFGVDPADVIGEGIPANMRWALVMELFIDYGLRRDGSVEGPHGSIQMAIDERGALIGVPSMLSYAYDSHADMMRLIMGWTHPALLATCFLHCKNVTVEQEPVHPKHAKEVRKRHGIEPAKFKRLIIEPLKQILRREGQADAKGVAHAMHICRGHFRDYREGKGLFGRYHQVVWTPMTVRGTKGDKPAPREMEVKI
jgi:hypothetical protein